VEILENSHSSIFINYAHTDNISPDPKKRWLDRFIEIAKPLVHQEEFSTFSDTEIKIGEDWHLRIQSQLAVAKAAVLLISPAFLASTYIRNSELPILLKNARDRGVRIFPLILAPCLFEIAKFKYPDPRCGPNEMLLSSLQAANSPSETLIELDEGRQNRILMNVARQIHDLVQGKAT
jgi:hypothetical protein